MAERVDLYGNYSHFTERAVDAVRKETFGVDIGQNSWLTADEYERFLPWLNLAPESHLLEVASGSGGPALHVARTIGCRVTGIDANEGGVATASRMATASECAERLRFSVADANARLPFDDDTFDAVICVDALNHFHGRLAVFREWRRVLRPGSRALFTDPVVLTGPVTNDELARRSSIGLFLFVPPGVNERLVEQAGLRLLRAEDVTANAALVSGRWHAAREAHKEDLIRIEGREHFAGLQRFFEVVHDLASERRLSRILYLVEKAS
jgi:SAM-dependent methyltransferase